MQYGQLPPIHPLQPLQRLIVLNLGHLLDPILPIPHLLANLVEFRYLLAQPIPLTNQLPTHQLIQIQVPRLIALLQFTHSVHLAVVGAVDGAILAAGLLAQLTV